MKKYGKEQKSKKQQSEAKFQTSQGAAAGRVRGDNQTIKIQDTLTNCSSVGCSRSTAEMMKASTA